MEGQNLDGDIMGKLSELIETLKSLQLDLQVPSLVQEEWYLLI